jgi:hypothetical protein
VVILQPKQWTPNVYHVMDNKLKTIEL